MATLLHKFSDVTTIVPAPIELSPRELAINTADGKLFTKKDDGTVIEIGASGSFAPTDAQYVVLASNATLTNESTLAVGNHVTSTVAGSTITLDWKYNPRKRAFIESECNAVGALTIAQIGTGAGTFFGVAGSGHYQTIAQQTTGTTATGRSAIGTFTSTSVVLGTQAVKFCTIVATPQLSTGAQTFIWQIGFLDNQAGASVDGLWFEYTHSVNSGKFTCNVSSNSFANSPIFDTGVTVAINTWYLLEIEVNAAATEAKFYLNGSLIHTTTTNIPSGAARATGCVVNTRKTVGTTAITTNIDYFGLFWEVTR